MRQDRRFADEEVATRFPADDMLELTGKKGTIMAVDTSGIHKGKVPEADNRLIIQLEFTNSFFGQKVHKVKTGMSFLSAHESFLNKYAPSFDRFM